MVLVNIYYGVRTQEPTSYRVDAKTYQDVVTSLINSDFASGQIYCMNGEIVEYDNPVTLSEIKYIIQEGYQIPLFVRSLSKTITISVNPIGIVRDIYNALVAKGEPIGSRVILAGRALDMDQPLALLGINTQTVFHVVKGLSKKVENRDNPMQEFVNVRTPFSGEVRVNVTYCTTDVATLIGRVYNNNQGFRLVKVKRSEYVPQLLEGHEIVPRLLPSEHFYLVPDYETLFASYSNSLITK